MTQVSNLTRIPQIVEIILADGRRTNINIMPKARPTLPEGAKVDANWIALNPNCIKILGEQKEEAKPIKHKAPEAPKDEDKEQK